MLSANGIVEVNQAQRTYARLAGILMLGAIIIAIDQPSMIALGSNRILELGAPLRKVCRQSGSLCRCHCAATPSAMNMRLLVELCRNGLMTA
jgi:hypothetical protein